MHSPIDTDRLRRLAEAGDLAAEQRLNQIRRRRDELLPRLPVDEGLALGYRYGRGGYGYGSGNGYGHGTGNRYGNGTGFGYGLGRGYGNGYGTGYGDRGGNGCGSGFDFGYGDGAVKRLGWRDVL